MKINGVDALFKRTVEPDDLLEFRRLMRNTLGSDITETIDRRGFKLLQWPNRCDAEKPFELSLEHETRLQPASRAADSKIMAALELCNMLPASRFLPECEPVKRLFLRAEQRPAGTQSIDLYYDVTGSDVSLIRAGFTVRERVQASGFMTWGTGSSELRPMNAELSSIPIGKQGITTRLEFNWREKNSSPSEVLLFDGHPLRFLADKANIETARLRPVLRHRTVRRKFNFVEDPQDDQADKRFVLNVDVIQAEMLDGSGCGRYVDIDLSSLHPVTETVLQQLDEIAAALMTYYHLEPNPDTKASRSLRACLRELSPVARTRSRPGPWVAPAEQVKIGLVGPGKVADQFLAPAIKRIPGCCLWSVFGRNPEKTQEFVARHEVEHRNAVKHSLDELLEDKDLHAVLIATPDASHAQQVIRAIQAGRHVLCEKPLVTDLDDGFALWEEARNSGLAVALGYHLRWHPAHLRAIELLEAGAIGEVRHVRALWSYERGDPQNWRSRAEGSRWWAASAFGTHMLDLLQWMLVPLCGEVLRISHFRSSATWRSENDETTVSVMEFASGMTAEITASVTFPSDSRLEIMGDRGQIVCERTLAQQTGGNLRIDNLEENIEPNELHMYECEIKDFITAIREQYHPTADVVAGLRNVQLLSLT